MEYATLNNGLKMPLEGFGVSRCRIRHSVSRRFWMPSPADTV